MSCGLVSLGLSLVLPVLRGKQKGRPYWVALDRLRECPSWKLVHPPPVEGTSVDGLLLIAAPSVPRIQRARRHGEEARGRHGVGKDGAVDGDGRSHCPWVLLSAEAGVSFRAVARL